MCTHISSRGGGRSNENGHRGGWAVEIYFFEKKSSGKQDFGVKNPSKIKYFSKKITHGRIWKISSWAISLKPGSIRKTTPLPSLRSAKHFFRTFTHVTEQNLSTRKSGTVRKTYSTLSFSLDCIGVNHGFASIWLMETNDLLSCRWKVYEVSFRRK